MWDVVEELEAESWGLPRLPCIIVERGNYNLQAFLELQKGRMDHMDQKTLLHKICAIVHSLHQYGIVHRYSKHLCFVSLFIVAVLYVGQKLLKLLCVVGKDMQIVPRMLHLVLEHIKMSFLILRISFTPQEHSSPKFYWLPGFSYLEARQF